MKNNNTKIQSEKHSLKSEIDGKITNLSSKTIPELCEIRDRELKLLNNKSFISKLKDKGAKIQEFHDKVVREIKAKQNEDEACRMFDNMRLNGVDEKFVQRVEWTSKIRKQRDEFLDSDDDSDPEDVLHILSQKTAQEKVVKVLEPEKALVTTEDLIKIGELPHIKYIVEKTELNPKLKQTGQFKPYKTTKTDVHNPCKEILRKKNKHWEVTAATPPPAIHGPAKVLSIEESLKLQKDYIIHLKEIEAQQAAEKLLARTGITIGEFPKDKSSFTQYRDLVSDDDDDDSDPEGSDKEIHDDEPERGGVVFTVMN